MACCCGSKAAVVAASEQPGLPGSAPPAAGGGTATSAEGVTLTAVDATAVMVVVRVRPPNARETAARALSVVDVNSKTSVRGVPKVP